MIIGNSLSPSKLVDNPQNPNNRPLHLGYAPLRIQGKGLPTSMLVWPQPFLCLIHTIVYARRRTTATRRLSTVAVQQPST